MAISSTSTRLAWCALLLAVAPWVQAQPPLNLPERAGMVKVVQGEVHVANAAGERALHPGDPVAQADTVRTGANSSTSLVLRDGTTLVLGANSRVNLQDFSYNATTQEGNILVSVLRGTMRMLTGLIGKTRPESVNITTPTSTIGILGTDFIVQVPEGGQ